MKKPTTSPSWNYFKDLPHGTKVRVSISGHTECEGAISIDARRNTRYICTNSVYGNNTDDKLGFKHSWQATSENISNVASLVVLTEELYSIF
jgi:hypothetical protein